ncbi:MAG: TonB-dependent receptor plug domain-containing protein [Bacteroidales bacterium]|nr:TonB-dependent receptor plug domain-containing protein [Bacteroidales bacterium]
MGVKWERIRRAFRILCFGLLFFGAGFEALQAGAILRGRVVNQAGRPLELVAVGVVNLTKPIGTFTDSAGFFELEVPSGVSLLVRFSHISYENVSRSMILLKGEVKNIQQRLAVHDNELSGVTVTGNRKGYVTIDPLVVRNMIGFTGGVEEVLRSLPGVNSNNELSSQYSVRGGNYDENLIYVNDIEIYRSFLIRSAEQEGLSFINPDLVGSTNFSSGGFEAKYGDKMSSVLDIRYREPKEFAGSVGLNFMGGNLHLEGLSKDKKFTYLLGLRHKATQYVLKTLDRKGNYKPSFTDFQTFMTYKLDERNKFSFLGNVAYNVYKFIPTTQQTRIGAYSDPLMFTVAFEGQERDVFTSYFGAFVWANRTSQKLKNSLTFSFFNTIEQESYDIEGAYLLSAVEEGKDDSFGGQGEPIGAGTFLNHGRDYLNGIITSLDYKGDYVTKPAIVHWGLRYRYEDIIDRINEWNVQDSAGYVLPNDWFTQPGQNPDLEAPKVQSRYVSDHRMQSHRLTGYAQGLFDFGSDEMYQLTAGVRMSYWSMNNEFCISPRLNFAYQPDWKTYTVFRAAIGHYVQEPLYKELRDVYGNLHTDVKAQKSIHAILSAEIGFSIWDRPFKFMGEAYYKYLYDLNPYEMDNVRIRYMGRNCAYGYATGVDLRLSGEFVPGAESWVSVAFLKTSENITFVDEATGVTTQTGMIPRPTDQLFSINVFFQDYFLRNKNMKVYVNGVFATGMPSGNLDRLTDPERMKWRGHERLPSYKRVDLGMAFRLKGPNKIYGPKNPLTYIKSIWLGLELFNMFQMNNTISYTWINTFDGRSFAIPNRLTPMQVNVKLDVEF